jgi:hypothetical protein
MTMGSPFKEEGGSESTFGRICICVSKSPYSAYGTWRVLIIFLKYVTISGTVMEKPCISPE